MQPKAKLLESRMGRKRRVCIYGGTKVGAELRRVISRLVPAIIKELEAVIISGGVKRNTKLKPTEQRSVDLAVLTAVKRYAKSEKERPESYMEAWIPDPDRSTRPHIIRMSKKDDVAIEILDNRSDLGRRLRLVRDVDLLVTVGGKTHTETTLEQALETDTPALPLPFTGGDSKKFWSVYKQHIQEWFPALDDDKAHTLERFSPKSSSKEHEEIVKVIVEVLASARVKCLVLLPYDDTRNWTVIKRAVEQEMCVERVDRKATNKTISENFAHSVKECLAIVADVTDANPSVMYEIGFARAMGIAPFLFSHRPIDKLPVYLREQNVIIVKGHDQLSEEISKYLRGTRRPDTR